MSKPEIPNPGKLVLSVLSSKWEFFCDRLQNTLAREFGAIDYQSPFIPFTETTYYDRELGKPISRQILAFEPLVEQNGLPEIKLLTNQWEKDYSRDGCRIFNLDPGLLTLERLVLATGKNFSHRVYLGQGIWADLTLIYARGDWMDLPWTFPDYAAEKTKTHLRAIREIYRRQLKNKTRT